MKYSYFPTGVCSRQINLELDDNGKIKAVSLWAAVQATLRAFVCLLKVWTQKTLLTD